MWPVLGSLVSSLFAAVLMYLVGRSHGYAIAEERYEHLLTTEPLDRTEHLPTNLGQPPSVVRGFRMGRSHMNM